MQNVSLMRMLLPLMEDGLVMKVVWVLMNLCMYKCILICMCTYTCVYAECDPDANAVAPDGRCPGNESCVGADEPVYV